MRATLGEHGTGQQEAGRKKHKIFQSHCCYFPSNEFRQVVVPDGRWFTLTTRVEGRHVVTRIDDKMIVDYTEEPNPQRPKGLEQRLIASGTFALQGHDPGSEVHYRNIKVRKLP